MAATQHSYCFPRFLVKNDKPFKEIHQLNGLKKKVDYSKVVFFKKKNVGGISYPISEKNTMFNFPCEIILQIKSVIQVLQSIFLRNFFEYT